MEKGTSAHGKPGTVPAEGRSLNRRAWIACAVGAVLGGAASSVLDSGRAQQSQGRQPVTSGGSGGPTEAKLPEWASEMLELEPARLLSMAGEYERLSARHRNDTNAAPGFERLLSLALASHGFEADMAAACAVRSLARLGRMDLVGIWADAIRDRRELSECNDALEDLLEAALEERQRLWGR